jgi:hypothetical protein
MTAGAAPESGRVANWSATTRESYLVGKSVLAGWAGEGAGARNSTTVAAMASSSVSNAVARRDTGRAKKFIVGRSLR